MLVAEGEGRKDAATHRLSGRAPDNRLVHFVPSLRGEGGGLSGAGDAAEERPGGTRGDGAPPRPGDMVTVEVTYAAPHHLVADGPALALRRTRAGDAWEARESAACGAGGGGVPGGSGGPGAVSLGMPVLRRS